MRVVPVYDLHRNVVSKFFTENWGSTKMVISSGVLSVTSWTVLPA
jgi:hypothetical protein